MDTDCWTRLGKIASFCIFVSFASFFTKEAISKWNDSPWETKTTWVPLKNMDFPALTICPVQDARWRHYRQLIETNDPLGIEARKLFHKVNK